MQDELWGEGDVGVGFFGSTSICEIQGFLDEKRATNICITLCIKGFLRSRWSVEMTVIGMEFVRIKQQKQEQKQIRSTPAYGNDRKKSKGCDSGTAKL